MDLYNYMLELVLIIQGKSNNMMTTENIAIFDKFYTMRLINLFHVLNNTQKTQKRSLKFALELNILQNICYMFIYVFMLFKKLDFS